MCVLGVVSVDVCVGGVSVDMCVGGVNVDMCVGGVSVDVCVTGSEMENVLNDFSKFVKLRYEELVAITTRFQDKVITLVNKLVYLGTNTSENATFLRPTGSSSAVLYGLPKVHKPGVPLRPIMAAYNIALFKLSKFLVPILSEFTTKEFTVKNSYEFTKYLSSFILPNNFFY